MKRGNGKVDFTIVIVQVEVDFDVFFLGGVYGNILVSCKGIHDVSSREVYLTPKLSLTRVN